MEFCCLSLIVSFTFFVYCLFDVVISSTDTFDWISNIQSSCNHSSLNETQTSNVNNVSIALFAWSSFLAVLFFVIFITSCCCSCCYLHIKKCLDYISQFVYAASYVSHSIEKWLNNRKKAVNIILKVCLEISFALFAIGSIVNVSLLLRNCLSSYLFISVSLLLYTVVIIIAVIATEKWIQALIDNKKIKVSLIIVVTFCKSISFAAFVSVFGIFVCLVLKDNIFYLGYIYLTVVIINAITLWITSIINRWCSYYFLVGKLHCIAKTIDMIVLGMYVISCIALIILTAMFFWHLNTTLSLIAVIFLSLSLIIGIFEIVIKICCCCCCHFSLTEQKNFELANLFKFS